MKRELVALLLAYIMRIPHVYHGLVYDPCHTHLLIRLFHDLATQKIAGYVMKYIINGSALVYTVRPL